MNIEAQACGLPVVASRIGGIPEYVTEDRTGLFFRAERPRPTCCLVRRLMEDSDLHRRMTQAARLDAVERFSIAAPARLAGLVPNTA